MDELRLYELADEYADSFINSVQFERFLEVNKEIKEKLAKEIIAFKTAESIYTDALSYGKYHPDLEKYKKRLIETKTKLYSHPLMIEYKKLEFELQSKLNMDLNDLKKSISNKLEITKNIIIND